MSNRRVSFSDFDIKYYDLPFDKQPSMMIENDATKKKKKKGAVSTHVLGCIGAKLVVKAIRFVSAGRKSSRKVSSTEGNLARSRSYVEAVMIDSHRAEALEDCIEFLNSSSL